MSVTLRYRPNADGTQTPYIDIYVSGDRKREPLKHLKIVKAKSQLDRDSNKQKKLLAEQATSKRAIEVQASVSGVIPTLKRSLNVLNHFRDFANNYSKKDKRVILAALAKFEQFLNESDIHQLTTNRLTRGLIFEFKDYLEQTLNGETPSNYFKKFKKALEVLVDEGLLEKNPAKSIVLKKSESINKEILTFDEIKLLTQTPIHNEEVKRAFLFSCYTGLRFCDVKVLSWNNINNGNVKLIQSKTARPVIVPLHEITLQILNEGKTDSGRIFNLPTHTACLKDLKVWVKKAGIKKHITWHCARHSFATGLIYYGSDVDSASSLLGHSSYAYTQRYVRMSEQLKETAVANLPS